MIRAEPVPLRTAPRPGLGAPERVFSRAFRGRGPVFRRRGAFRAQFRRPIRPAVGRRLAPPPGAEKRRRSGAEPAQPARGRGGAAGRDRPREARSGARAGGTGLRRVPHAERPGDPFRPERLAAVAADLQSPLDPTKDGGARRRPPEGRARRGRPAPIAAAAAAEAVIALRADAEPLAIYCADAALAKTLSWPTPLPLLAGELFLRRATGEGRRPRPGEAGWSKLVALSYARAALAALDLAQDLSRRAARLADAAPKLRAKGKTGAIEALLADDAVSAAAPIAGLSDRARRRLFERLHRLGAARELTGRATFRLYGL